jgi:hypothetical protein
MIAGVIMTAAEAASLFVGKPHAFYIFYATIEISCTIFILWFVWKWKESADTMQIEDQLVKS